MGISIYLVLLIVLLIFNLVFWLLVIWFRILFDCDFGKCCRTPAAEDEEPSGHRNLGFIDHEDILGRPSTIAERMESPPSYEEALKYDQFGFHVSPPPPVNTTPLSVPFPSPPSLSRTSASPPSPDMPTSSGEGNLELPQTPPSRMPDTRPRTSTSSSLCPLTPIREEEGFDDPMPITMVIDCIGVQTSRLVSNCDTKVDLAGGESLHEHSGC